MPMKINLILLLLCIFFPAIHPVWSSDHQSSKQLLMEIKTDQGTITAKLFYDNEPIAVSNLVSLANGGFFKNLSFKSWNSGMIATTPHPDEKQNYFFTSSSNTKINQDKPGLLSMQLKPNSPNIGFSGLIIMMKPSHGPHNLIVGEVLTGFEVVEKIALAKQNESRIELVTIKGDWFRPGDLSKVKLKSKEEIIKFSNDYTTKMITTISGSFGLESLKSLELQDSKIDTYKSALNYRVTLKSGNQRQVKLIVSHILDFEVLDFSFSEF